MATKEEAVLVKKKLIRDLHLNQTNNIKVFYNKRTNIFRVEYLLCDIFVAYISDYSIDELEITLLACLSTLERVEEMRIKGQIKGQYE